jgi:hypothetical protein
MRELSHVRSHQSPNQYLKLEVAKQYKNCGQGYAPLALHGLMHDDWAPLF